MEVNMKKQLNISKEAINLTHSFRSMTNARDMGRTVSNAMLICTSLIDDEQKGFRFLSIEGTKSKLLTISDIFQEIGESNVFEHAKGQARNTVKFDDKGINEINLVLNHASNVVSNPADAYLLSIMAAQKIHEKYAEGGSSVNFVQYKENQKPIARSIWLN